MAGCHEPLAGAAGAGCRSARRSVLHCQFKPMMGDPLSAMIFATAMALAISGALGDGAAVRNLSYIDDTLLLGAAEDVADLHEVLAARLRHTGLELQPIKNNVWAPAPCCLSKHLRRISEALGQDCLKFEHLLENLVAKR